MRFTIHKLGRDAGDSQKIAPRSRQVLLIRAGFSAACLPPKQGYLWYGYGRRPTCVACRPELFLYVYFRCPFGFMPIPCVEVSLRLRVPPRDPKKISSRARCASTPITKGSEIPAFGSMANISDT